MLGSWLALVIGLTVLGTVAGGVFKVDFSLPGSESQRAFDILEQRGFGDRTGEQSQVVFEAQQGVDDPAVKAAIEGFLTKVTTSVDNVAAVSPYTEAGARQVAEGRTIAYAELNFADRPSSNYVDDAKVVKALRDQIAVPGLRVELGSDIFAEQRGPQVENTAHLIVGAERAREPGPTRSRQEVRERTLAVVDAGRDQLRPGRNMREQLWDSKLSGWNREIDPCEAPQPPVKTNQAMSAGDRESRKVAVCLRRLAFGHCRGQGAPRVLQTCRFADKRETFIIDQPIPPHPELGGALYFFLHGRWIGQDAQYAHLGYATNRDRAAVVEG